MSSNTTVPRDELIENLERKSNDNKFYKLSIAASGALTLIATAMVGYAASRLSGDTSEYLLREASQLISMAVPVYIAAIVPMIPAVIDRRRREEYRESIVLLNDLERKAREFAERFPEEERK